MAEMDPKPFAPKKRYLATKEPEHGCCFEAVIYDTSKTSTYYPKGERICEVADYSMARKIEALLNAE